ncbi:hypothetical protein FA95DRAFT_1612918 [Auriscalpium vulgare]|uniref:Uncharacterized protein n=1 Tax=Auriscalpium vulgare TaxID=40419 RepID=A0ACB8R4I9_9AGAM|nr:hypothetical protein FA95DRAFT_1612918 [Auriscalpium vulgare]
MPPDSAFLQATSGGLLKYDSISKFFDSIIDGTADLSAANEAAKEEEFELSEEEQEIERKQEAQRLALAHGGFTDMIDFEEAVKKYGMDFHDSNGYGGMLSDMPKKKKAEDKAAAGEAEAKDERVEDPIHRILRVQREKAEQKEREKGAMPKTGDAGQIVLEAPTDAPHTPTATASAAEATPSAASEAVPEPEAAPVVEESEEQYEAASKQAAPEPAATPEPAEEEPAATPEPAGETEPAEEADPVEEAASSGHVKDEL